VETEFGEFRLIAYESEVDGRIARALIKGEMPGGNVEGVTAKTDEPVLVRHACALPEATFWIDRVRMPRHAAKELCGGLRRKARSFDLSASDFAGIF